MAALSMLKSVKAFGSLSSVRYMRQPIINASESRGINIRLLPISLPAKHSLYTSSRSSSVLANQSFPFLRIAVKDIHSTSRACFFRQDMLYSSEQSSFLNKMYPTAAPKEPEPSKTQSKSKKKEKKRPKWWPDSWFSWKGGLLTIAIGGAWTSFCLLLMWGPPRKDEEGNVIEDQFTWLSYLGYPLRAIHEGQQFSQAIVEPSSKRLLPDPLKEPYYQPPYTLVLEHDGVLIASKYSMEKGWIHKKRPGLDQFLQQVGPPLCEVVIYTHKTGMTAYPITTSLDPQGYISFRLFRDATLYDKEDGAHVKDLDCLNRDVSKVIVIDTDYKRVKKHPTNALLLQRWKGEDGDDTLPTLAAFIRAIAASGVDDVRPVLEHYSQYDNPLEAFKQRQNQLREQQQAAAQAKQSKSLAGGWGFGFAGKRSS